MRDLHPLDLPISVMEDYARRVSGLNGRITAVKTTPIAAGFVAAGLYRVELIFELPGGEQNTAAFVQKYTGPVEVRLMQTLAQVHGADALPQVLDTRLSSQPDNRFGSWFVTPFYPGAPLTWNDVVPESILRTLARVHTWFENRTTQFDDLYRIDEGFFHRTIQNALDAVEQAQKTAHDPVFSAALRGLQEARENRMLYQVLAVLPLTLTHGDVHPGNILRGNGSGAMLIDWGTARVAPAMLDLANMVPYGSPQWHSYLAAVEADQGRPVDPRAAALGYHWATVQVNTQYLPFAVEHLTRDHVQAMAQKTAAAQASIRELL